MSGAVQAHRTVHHPARDQTAPARAGHDDVADRQRRLGLRVQGRLDGPQRIGRLPVDVVAPLGGVRAGRRRRRRGRDVERVARPAAPPHGAAATGRRHPAGGQRGQHPAARHGLRGLPGLPRALRGQRGQEAEAALALRDVLGDGPLLPDPPGPARRVERRDQLFRGGPVRRVLGQQRGDQGPQRVGDGVQPRFAVDDLILHRRDMRPLVRALPLAANTRTAPSEKRSAAGPTRRPRTCSGAP